MFTIRRGESEYYSEDGSFVTLAEWQLIKWYPYYMSCTQDMMKLQLRDTQTVNAYEVLQKLLVAISGLAPELIQFASGCSEESLKEVSAINDLAVLRGGILEHKETIAQLQHALAASKKREEILTSEAQKLVDVSADYERVLKELSP